MIKIKQYLTAFLILNLFFTSFLTSIDYAQASDIKTIVVTFASAPTPESISVTKTHLKYNKDFAWSYSYDDGIVRGYDTAFKYMNGGYSSYLGQYFGGLYFTDGAGNNVPFRGGYAFYTRNADYSDIHINTPNYITWTQLQDAVDNGWNIFNHGYTSATVDNLDDVYYIGDPGGHATGSLDYVYELTQANVDIANNITLRDNNGVTTTPLNVSQVILPNGDNNYIQPAFDNSFKAVYAQSNIFPFDGSTTTAPSFTDVTTVISSNRHVMPRWFDYEYRYLPGGEIPNGLFNKVDELASLSTSTAKYWSQAFTHQITTSTDYPDWNGGLTWTSWKSLMDHVENTYGRFGADNIWVAGAEEVYNYMMVKQNSVVSQVLDGDQLTITIDATNVPANLKNYSLSLLVSASTAISSINYGTDFTYHTDNKTTGLINLDWGVNAYVKNDITRVESLVTAAEVSKRQSDIDVAEAYVSLLTTNPTSIKTAFESRLDAIEVPLRTWYVNVNGVILANCDLATTTKTYPSANHPSYNWNYFTVGLDSSVSCSDLLNLRDSDNQLSSLSLSNTAPFKNGGLLSTSTTNNSAIYPDVVIEDKAQIYTAISTPAKVKIYGLESIKTYNIKLYGYTSSTGVTGDSAITNYTIASTTKELIVKENLNNTVEFVNVVPVSGEIEITVMPKDESWGSGVLNAIEIKENILAAPSPLSYTSPNTYTKDSAITPLLPTVTGLGITYSVSPNLPAGLTINSSTGIISGTPTEVATSTVYTVTATNTGGSSTFDLTIIVNDWTYYSLYYIAGSGGAITGSSTQFVVHGSNGQEVTATPNTGYYFVKWSDDITNTTRTDLNITNNLSVTAQFATNAVNSNNSLIVSPPAIGTGLFDVSIPMNSIGSVGLISNSINILAYINSQANFIVPESSNNWTPNRHSLKIFNLDLFSNIITLIISSEPQIINLYQGESKEVDLDGDNINDILLTFVDFYVNRAEITVTSLKSSNINESVDTKVDDVMNEERLLSKQIDKRLIERLAGSILLQVEKLGQAWYLDVISLSRYYLADGPTAYEALRKFGLGITNVDLNKIPVAAESALPPDFITSEVPFSSSLIKRVSGRILLQVESHGEAWYVNPSNGFRYYLANGEAAYQIMSNLSLGITNDNIRKITLGDWE